MKNSKESMKVIIMKAKAPNGNNRTYRTIAPLDATIADVCTMRNIPLMSILSATVTAPLTEADAFAYMQQDMIVEYLDPSHKTVKVTIGAIAF